MILTKNDKEKATIREVYNLLDPMKEDITEIKTLLKTHLRKYGDDCKENKEEHKNFIGRRLFIGISAFLAVVLTFVSIMQFFIR